MLLDELADAVVEGRRKKYKAELTVVPLLIIDDFGMRKLAVDSGGGSAGDCDAPIRAGQHVVDFEPGGGGLGEAVGGYGGGGGDAGSVVASRSSAEVSAEELADEHGDVDGGGVGMWK